MQEISIFVVKVKTIIVVSNFPYFEIFLSRLMPSTAPHGSLSSLTIDCTIFGFEDFQLKILLVKRNIDPSRGMWQLPGGWIGEGEALDSAAQRILEEATGVPSIYMEQMRAFGDVNRYPDFRIITIGYTALIKPENYILRHGLETSDVRWFNAKDIPELAFDHGAIAEYALENLKKKIREEPVSFELLPSKFTLPEIQALYESVLGEPHDRRNFRKKILSMEILERLDETQQGGAHRAPRLYRFDRKRYKKRMEEGFVFEF